MSEAVEEDESCGIKVGERMPPMVLDEKGTTMVTYTYSVKWNVCCLCILKGSDLHPFTTPRLFSLSFPPFPLHQKCNTFLLT